MRRTTWIVVAGLMLWFNTTNTSHAQYYVPPYWSGYAQQQSMYFQFRIGNGGFFTYNTGAYYRVGPALPVFYGPVAVPIGVPVPVGIPVNPQPPVVIQNIIQQPPEPPRDRGLILPPEVNPPRPAIPAIPKARPAEMPKLGPAPKPLIELPELPREQPRLPNRADADAVVEQGRKAFAGEQYGRALELFRKARGLMPNEPSVYFLISQTQFALGKYQDALTSITTGMALRNDWAEARYAPRELYGRRATFDDHLKLLRQTLTTFRDDADLKFLLAHQLWFDGQREEAKALHGEAAKQGSTVAAGFRP